MPRVKQNTRVEGGSHNVWPDTKYKSFDYWNVLQEQGKDRFCKKVKEKYVKEQQRRNQFMEEYLLAVGDGKEFENERSRNEYNEYENDI